MVREAGRSNVRGPNSALTEFLRSRGIRIQNQGRQGRAAPADPVLDDADEATPEVQSEAVEASSSTAEIASPETVPVRKPKKRKKKSAEDDDDDADFEPLPRPSTGQIEFCVECNVRFTVTPYNKDAPDGRGLLCMKCGKALMGAPVKVRAAPQARKKRAKATLDGERFLVPKLQDLSIRIIAKHIDQVEALGDIGHFNLDKICQIICKNRQLSPETLPLFLDAALTSLSLYDCATLNAQCLTQVAQLCPHLTSLRLHNCGQITDKVMRFYAEHFANLKSATFFGSFLITTQCWQNFFHAYPKLEEIGISDTSRFDEQTAKALVESCHNLHSVTLRRITHLGSDAIMQLASLTELTHLDLSHAGGNVSDEAIGAVLAANPMLESLNLTGLNELTDVTLENIGKHCKHLKTLCLNECDLLTDTGCAALFSNWSGNAGLKIIELERCCLFGDASVAAILQHSGKSLHKLVLNSLDAITSEGAGMLAALDALPVCHELDISWIRVVDDLIVRRLVENMPALEKLLVWGNNLLTSVEHPGKAVVVGRESG